MLVYGPLKALGWPSKATVTLPELDIVCEFQVTQDCV